MSSGCPVGQIVSQEGETLSAERETLATVLVLRGGLPHQLRKPAILLM